MVTGKYVPFFNRRCSIYDLIIAYLKKTSPPAPSPR